MSLTLEQLQRIMPAGAAGAAGAMIIGPLNTAMDRFRINTPQRIAEYLGQIADESGQLTRLREDLNYSAGRLRAVWPRRFPDDATAALYAHQPEKLANHVYAGLYGNGDEASGDGFRYRGAGYLQHTFKANHAAIGRAFQIPVEKVGDWLATHPGAAMASAWYWNEHGCNELADSGNTDACSDIINLGHRTTAIGDAIGYETRLHFRNLAYNVLGIV